MLISERHTPATESSRRRDFNLGRPSVPDPEGSDSYDHRYQPQNPNWKAIKGVQKCNSTVTFSLLLHKTHHTLFHYFLLSPNSSLIFMPEIS